MNAGRAAPGRAARFKIGCDNTQASRLCADLAASLYARYGSCEPLQDLELALSELLSNLVRHGQSTACIGVLLRCDTDRIRLSLVDDGAPCNMAKLPASLPDDPFATSGRGLWLVRRMVPGFRGHRWGRYNVHGLRCELPPAASDRGARVPAGSVEPTCRQQSLRPARP